MYYMNPETIAEALRLLALKDDSDIASVSANVKGQAIIKTVNGKYVIDTKSQKVWHLLDRGLGIWENI